MDEARVVLGRIRRIDALQRERAGPAALLAEVERLLLEARAGLDAEDGDEDEDREASRAPDGARGAAGPTWKAMIAM
jgi:hypothetical protein